MDKNELKAIRNVVNYETALVTTPETQFKGIVLKSYNNENSHNHCFLVDEENKQLHHVLTKPLGFINNNPGLCLSFTKEKDVHKVVHTLLHYTVMWFDEPKSFNQIVNILIV